MGENKYNERGRPQYIRTINSEPWKYEKTMWWEVQVSENIEELTGITYANALQDKNIIYNLQKIILSMVLPRGSLSIGVMNLQIISILINMHSVIDFICLLKPDKFGG